MTKKSSEIEEVKEMLKSRIEQVEELEKEIVAHREQYQKLAFENLKLSNRIDALLAALVLNNSIRDDAYRKYLLQKYKFEGSSWVKLAE